MNFKGLQNLGGKVFRECSVLRGVEEPENRR
jgi:hypothetical protein